MIMQILRRLNLIFLAIAFMLPAAAGAQEVGLVLSGGGAKGLSHIGVIKALEENNIPIDYICGTSMGSIVGGLYAIGMTPEEMIYLFNSKEFKAWYKGAAESGYEFPLLKKDKKPEFASVTFSKKRGKGEKGWKVNLPTSLVSPYPMDLAVTQIFAAANGAAKGNFDSLMIPFFCVAADIVKKSEYVAKSGDLGSAIRASMTYPFYFKPIVIDSTLLFDGGFYNNFPWELMLKYYSPDVLIGSKCVRGEYKLPEDDNIVAQIETMLTTSTDYEIPDDKGVVIKKVYDYGLMDFDKVNEIALEGYQAALEYIPELKKRIKREMSDSELYRKRLEFRKKWVALNFDSVAIEGNVTEGQKELITNVIRGRKSSRDSLFSFFDMKKGYYQLVAMGGLNTIYPSSVMTSDSSYLLKLRVSERSPLKFSIGGNISSSVLNQGYVGLTYSKFDRSSWTAGVDLHIGRYYSGGILSFRHNFLIDPLAYYEITAVGHQYNYFSATNSFFSTSQIQSSVQESETYVTASIATPASFMNNLLVKFNFTGGYTGYRYFTSETYSNYDRADNTNLRYVSPQLVLERNTTNYLMYPTSGKRQSLSVKYIYGMQKHIPGSTSNTEFVVTGKPVQDMRFRFISESYYSIAKWMDLGVYVDLALGSEVDFGNYKSALMFRPSFRPFPHAKTMVLDNYRAASFLGVTVNPVFKITPTILLHTSFGYFQPYKKLVEKSKGSYEYSSPFPRGGFVGNASAVWQSPIGPVSFSVSYYEQSEIKWFPQFNIGFLLFKDRFLSN